MCAADWWPFFGTDNGDWEHCFSGGGMFPYERGYWGSNGGVCLALASDAEAREEELGEKRLLVLLMLLMLFQTLRTARGQHHEKIRGAFSSVLRAAACRDSPSCRVFCLLEMSTNDLFRHDCGTADLSNGGSSR